MSERLPLSGRSEGFTLVEMIMVIVITGIIAGVVTIFLQKPVQGYFDAVRRAGLSDVADGALRRIARDIQTALPNSIRSTDANNYFLEFLPVRSGGRYCASSDCGDALDTSAADTAFTVLGPCLEIRTGDGIVIYNTGQAGANAYAAAENRAPFSAAAADSAGCAPGTLFSKVGFSGFQFPRDSPTYRFDVISTPVTYACEPGTATLWRYSGYAIQAGQPTSIAALNGFAGVVKAALVATNVVCPSDASNLGSGFEVRNADGLVSLRIELRDSSGETINLYREVHIENAP